MDLKEKVLENTLPKAGKELGWVRYTWSPITKSSKGKLVFHEDRLSRPLATEELPRPSKWDMVVLICPEMDLLGEKVPINRFQAMEEKMGYDLISQKLVKKFPEEVLEKNRQDALNRVDEMRQSELFNCLAKVEQVTIEIETIMGADNYPNGPYFRFNTTAWPTLLKLARLYGWDPEGTKVDRDFLIRFEQLSKAEAEKIVREWDGTYLANDHQWVSAKDALNLSNAIEKALPDIPDHEASDYTNVVELSDDEDVEEALLDSLEDAFESQPDIMGYFSGKEGKEHLIHFIVFCRQGQFRIT